MERVDDEAAAQVSHETADSDHFFARQNTFAGMVDPPTSALSERRREVMHRVALAAG
jgi:hypothetical protein